jgi:NAD-dependent deacetylase
MGMHLVLFIYEFLFYIIPDYCDGGFMGEKELNDKLIVVVEMLADAQNIVVFTGAGVSTESGIPDFRSPGGIWSKFDPDDFTIDKFLYNPETRRKQWRFLMESGIFVNAQPNKAHMAVAELERIGKLECVITQNVDNLHQKAGNSPEKVYELHGNMNWLRCLGCYERYSVPDAIEKFKALDDAPVCERCQGILKPDVIFFGEKLPQQTLSDASRHASGCDLFIVIGSSLVVYPAAYMPIYAKGGGAKLVIINIGETPYDGNADVLINASAGEVMEKIVEQLRAKLSQVH